MKNIFIKVFISIMFFVLGISFQAVLAMEVVKNNAADNNYILMKVNVFSNTYTRFSNDVIFRFDETIGQRFGKRVQIYGNVALETDTIAQAVERSENYSDDNSNIKLIMVRVPAYNLSSTAIYEKGFDRSALDKFSLIHYDFSKSNYNATGYLCIPKGEGPFPCAILCHGSEGNSYMKEYMNSLANDGIAVVSFNRFSHRMFQYIDQDGKVEVHTKHDQLRISLEAEIIDTLRIAQVMGTHPKIDRSKIGYIGWSRGGLVALECSMQRNIDLFYPGFQPAFCVNYYSMPLIQRKDKLITPLLFLHGANDDYTPISRLIAYINYLLGEESIVVKDLNEKKTYEIQPVNEFKPIKLVIYPNSGHAFDKQQITIRELCSSIIHPKEFWQNAFGFLQYKLNEAYYGSLKVSCPDFMNMSECCVRFHNDGSFLDLNGQEHPWHDFPSFMKSKIKYGVTLEINQNAGLEAWQEVLMFIKKHTTTVLD